ncbi:PaaX family transcriptional regulator [Gordonia sp. NPDC003429]
MHSPDADGPDIERDATMTVTTDHLDALGAVGSRRRQVSAASARALLLTILGEFVYPRGDAVWTSTFTGALGALGIEEKSARQAIARSANEGLLESHRAGRRVRWTITDPGRLLLDEGTRRIYSFLTDDQSWDGRWLVLSTAIPETQRQLRHKLRTRLTWAGLGSPSPGIWITPDTTHETEVRRVVDELGLDDRAYAWIGPLSSIGSPQRLIADAWSLDEVESSYLDFIDTYATMTADTGSAAFTAQVRLVQDWRRFPFLDPDLPRELLDHAWPGRRAAQLFHTKHAEWHQPAQEFWEDLSHRE